MALKVVFIYLFMQVCFEISDWQKPSETLRTNVYTDVSTVILINVITHKFIKMIFQKNLQEENIELLFKQ